MKIMFIAAIVVLSACHQAGQDVARSDTTVLQKTAPATTGDTLRLPEKIRYTYLSLLKATSFAMGGVGVAGTISMSEKMYDTLMEQPNNLAIMLSLVKTGTPAAQMYGLTGLQHLSYANRAEVFESFRARQDSVATIEGCIMMKKPVSLVAADIDRH